MPSFHSRRPTEVQGLRIDFVLASPGLLARVESCEVLGVERLPAKWSDHAGLLLELRGLPPPPPHRPCPEWLRLHRRFVDTSQRSILGMFARKRPAAASRKGAEAAAAAPPGSEAEQAKRRRTGGDGTSAAPLSPASPDGSLGAAAAAEQHPQRPSKPPSKQQDRAAKAVPGQRTIGSFFAEDGGRRC